MSVGSIIEDFNTMLLDLLRNLSDVCPNSFIGTSFKDIEKVIKRAEDKKVFIETFCIKVLKYKSQIDEKDEQFFLQRDYDEDLKDNSSLANRVLEFKGIWEKLSNDNKQLTWQYMQFLCQLAQEYFVILYA